MAGPFRPGTYSCTENPGANGRTTDPPARPPGSRCPGGCRRHDQAPATGCRRSAGKVHWPDAGLPGREKGPATDGQVRAQGNGNFALPYPLPPRLTGNRTAQPCQRVLPRRPGHRHPRLPAAFARQPGQRPGCRPRLRQRCAGDCQCAAKPSGALHAGR
ncbi:hypothetical protein D3C85_1270720 [compost metagenome]